MSIKVTIGESKTQSEKPFPKLMKHSDGTITFFKSKGIGTHIFAPEHVIHIIGKHGTVISMESYTDFNEPITLQND